MVGSKTFGSRITVLVFLLPSLVGFAIFILAPTIATVGLSLTNFSGGSSLDFVGLRNYVTAFSSARFLNAIGVTFRFVLFSVFFQLGFGLIFALLLNGNLIGKTFFRGLFFLPVVLSNIAVSLAFMLMLNPSRGPINQFLVSLGMEAQPWLTSPDTALGTIVSITVWQSFGYFMVLFIAGLQTISPSLYENADLDGASKLQKLKSITLPMLTPTTFFAVTIAIIRGFQVFDQVFMMTGGQDGGGPSGSTSVLVFVIYRNAFANFQMGYASSQATVLLFIVLLITVIQYRGQRRWVNYDLA
jgi:multiple sugar transport system permease protein